MNSFVELSLVLLLLPTWALSSGNASFADWWPMHDVIPYYVQTSTLIPEKLQWIAWAFETVENQTCLVFEKRSTPPEEAKYISIKGDRIDGCKSDTGSIVVGEDCSPGEFLSSLVILLGIKYTVTRSDRDEYLHVEPSALGLRDYDINPDTLLLFPYDYESISHNKPSNQSSNVFNRYLTSPYYVGQRLGLSSLDIASLEFLYHNCTVPQAPTCSLSKQPDNDERVICVNPNTVFNLTAVGHFVTGHNLVGTIRINGNVNQSITAASPFNLHYQTVLTPDIGRLEISFTFAVEGNMDNTVECTQTVEVMWSNQCNGKQNDEGCLGSATCQSSGFCKCDGSHVGPACGGIDGCLENFDLGFDAPYGPNSDYGLIGNLYLYEQEYPAAIAYRGDGSLKFRGSGRYVINAYSAFNHPRDITFYMWHSPFDAINFSITASETSLSTEDCFSFQVKCTGLFGQCTAWSSSSGKSVNLNIPVHPNSFAKLQARLSYDNDKDEADVEFLLNDQLIGSLQSGCMTNVFQLQSSSVNDTIGVVYVDGGRFSCRDFVVIESTASKISRTVQKELQTGTVGHNVTISVKSAFQNIQNCTVSALRGSVVADFLNQEFCSQPVKLSKTVQLPPLQSYSPQLDDLIKAEITLSNGIVISESMRISGWCNQDYDYYKKHTFIKGPVNLLLAADQQVYRPVNVTFSKVVANDDGDKYRIQIKDRHSNSRDLYLNLTSGGRASINIVTSKDPVFAQGSNTLIEGELVIVDVHINFSSGEVDLYINNRIYLSSVPIFSKDEDLNDSEWGITAVYLLNNTSNFSVTCPEVIPALSGPVEVPTGIPFTIRIERGTASLSEIDAAFLQISNGDCSNTETTSGVFKFIREDATHWEIPSLVEGNYSVCYSVDGSKPSIVGYVMVTLAVRTTAAPTYSPSGISGPTAEPTITPTDSPSGISGSTAEPTTSPASGTPIPRLTVPPRTGLPIVPLATDLPTSIPTSSQTDSPATPVPSLNESLDSPLPQWIVVIIIITFGAGICFITSHISKKRKKKHPANEGTLEIECDEKLPALSVAS